jgi:CRP/FNR family transcriptional regulator, cyclic AMP receptor protein
MPLNGELHPLELENAHGQMVQCGCERTASLTAQRPAGNAGRLPKRPHATTVALTRFDHELLDAVGGAERNHAGGALLACGYRFAAGPIDLAAGGWPDTTFALLLLRGALTHQTRAASGRMIAFLASGDVLMPFLPDPLELSGSVSVAATEEVLLAALDQRFIQAAAIWPKLMIIIQRRVCEQHNRLALHGAICQLPHIEQRLVALMWHLADRFGKVTAEGIVITRPLNHQTLADLSGARRPTVTLALKALRERDHLRRRPDGTWLLLNPIAPSLSLEDKIEELKISPRPSVIAPAHRPQAQAVRATAAGQAMTRDHATLD